MFQDECGSVFHILTNISLITQNQSNIRCQFVTTSDYLSFLFTTSGELLGIPLLLRFHHLLPRRNICLINFFSVTLCFVFLFSISVDHR